MTSIIRCRRFIGRRDELATLLELARGATAGGFLAAIEGEPGLGKSRLIGEFGRMLESEHTPCYVAQCLEEANAPFAPFVPIFRALIARRSQPLDPWVAQSLAAILPEYSGAATRPASYTPLDKRQHFDAFAELLRGSHDAGRYVIVIEDVHWSDVTSMEFLYFLTRSQIEPRPVIVVTYRLADLEESAALRAVFVKLQRAMQARLALLPLTDREMDAFMADALEGSEGVSEERRRAIRGRVEGNPLFAEELLRHVAEAAIASTETRLPVSIRQTVLTRFQRLGTADQHLLLIAAVIGRAFESEFLSRTARRPQSDVMQALRIARDLQLVEENEAGKFRFRHALTREALYGELLKAQAQVLHAAILTELEAAGQPDLRLHDLAYHAWAAADATKAPLYNERAGDAAMAARAPHEAMTCFLRALDFINGDRDLARVWKKLALGADFASDAPRAQYALTQAVSYLEKIGAHKEVADLYFNLAVTYNLTGEMSRFFAALALARDALRGTQHDLLRHSLNAQYCAGMGRIDEAEESLRCAAALQGETDQLSLVRFFHASATTHFAAHRPSAAVADAQRALEHAALCGDVREQILAMLRLGWRFQEAIEPASAIATFAQAAELAQAEHYFGYAAWALAFKARHELITGALEAARGSLRRSIALSSDADLPQIRHFHFDVGLQVGSRLEDAVLLRDLEATLHCTFDDLASVPEEFTPFMGSVAEVMLAQGRADDARAALRRAAAAFVPGELAIGNPKMHMGTLLLIGAHGDLAVLPVARERLVDAQQIYPAEGATLALFDAYVAARNGAPPQEVRSAAAAAAQLFRAYGHPHEEALALELLGRPHEALDLYRRVGNSRDVARLQRALTPVNRLGRAASALTTRELQIARMVAERKSNREIARALSISERTVETHTSSMFAKLGIKSRSEVASAALGNRPEIQRQ